MSTIAKVLVAITFAIFLMAVGSHVADSQSAQDYTRLQHDVVSLREGNEALRARNARMAQRIDAMRSDARVIERRARRDLRMVRRDEVLILLNQPER